MKAIFIRQPRELPILFSGPMVRAVKSGAKTQTRMIMKPQPADDICPHQTPNPSYQGWISSLRHKYGSNTTHTCPYGQSGDRLWVREKWAVSSIYDGIAPSKINPDNVPNWCKVRYAATDERLGLKDRPSIHMPRWASRIMLDIVDVRVERLQDISDADAIAEGLFKNDAEGKYAWSQHDLIGGPMWSAPIKAFEYLWKDIYGEQSWDANPWVIEFRKVPDELGRAA